MTRLTLRSYYTAVIILHYYTAKSSSVSGLWRRRGANRSKMLRTGVLSGRNARRLPLITVTVSARSRIYNKKRGFTAQEIFIKTWRLPLSPVKGLLNYLFYMPRPLFNCRPHTFTCDYWRRDA